MGLWSGIKYALNSSVGGADFKPLDTMIGEVNDNIYIQALLQNLNNATVDWVLNTAPNLGRVLNAAFNINSPILAEFKTLGEIVNSKEALTAIVSSNSAITLFETSGTILDALGNSVLKTTMNASASGSSNFNAARAGRIFLISQKLLSSTSGSNALVRYTITDNATITTPLSILASGAIINRFMTGLNIAASGQYYMSMAYTFVPCE